MVKLVTLVYFNDNNIECSRKFHDVEVSLNSAVITIWTKHNSQFIKLLEINRKNLNEFYIK